MSFRRTAFLFAAGVSLSLTACQHRHARHTLGPRLDVSIASVSLGVVGDVPHYSVQGVLEQDGVPVSGPMTVNATILVDGAPIAGSTSGSVVDFENDGRFSARFEIAADPSALAIGNDATVQLSIWNGVEFVAAGGPLALDFAPRAYTARHALQAEEAMAAEFASSAGSLTDVEVVDLSMYYSSLWTDYGRGYQEPRATRRGNLVTIEGMVESIPPGTNSEIMILPEQLRPPKRLVFMAYGFRTTPGDGPVYRVDVHPSGQVSVVFPNLVGVEWISLSGISYSVE